MCLYLDMKLRIFLFLLFFANPVFAQDFGNIKRYKVNYALAVKEGEKWIGIRSFICEGNKYMLLVAPQTLMTRIDRADNYTVSNLAFGNVQAIFSQSTYGRVMSLALQNGKFLQNAGIDHAIPKEKGIALTIDLCPSHKDLDRVIFQALINEFKNIERPVSLAISVSGKWMLKHEADLNWLKNLMIKNEIDITWINHSYTHEVNKLPLNQNFMLANKTNMDTEILENEKVMLKYGLTPSIFFRFPGLVSDQQLVAKLETYGLVPVGSDAWLAKGEKPIDGSIVLIHGNGNEEIGVTDFIQLLKTKQIDVKNKQWLLFDLRNGLANEFNPL